MSVSMAKALEALNVTDWYYDSEPSNEAEFLETFKKVTGADENGTAILSDDSSKFGVTWTQVSAKMKELSDVEPLRRLREERNSKLAETDWWASSDLTMTDAQKKYRTDLRDITKEYSSLDDVKWPTKP
tara:strand:- start:1018 stop:1404 length:387 start_codon:yes stop_codon:yes gene_type:complete